MENSRKAKPNHRTAIFIVFLMLVLVWAALGTMVWAGKFKPLFERSNIAVAMGTVVAVTTWPGHELILGATGPGFGANAVSEFSLVSFVFFLVFSAVLFSPILLLLRRNLPSWVGLLLQVLILAVVSCLFWRFGRG